ncbi:12894_t:CDS:2, partial [Funneliformis geosporum]
PEEWCIYNSNRPVCLNHRPPSASSTVPVTLHCSIFGTFEDLCEEDPKREDNLFTYNFCREMARFYTNEAERQNNANSLLSKYLDCKVEPVMLERNRSTDGTVSTNDLYRKINIEYKKETCSTNSCAHLENCGYYLSFCKSQKNVNTNMPCFLINIAGLTFTVYSAVLSDTAIVDPLTPIYYLFWLKNNEKMMLSLSRAFRALRLSLQELD